MRLLTERFAFQGETLALEMTAPAAVTSVYVHLSSDDSTADYTCTNSDGVWKFCATPDLTGPTRWVMMANAPDGASVLANGSIFIRPLRSKWRDVVAAIDAAIETWGSNPNQTVTAGEISITAKSLDDLVSLRAEYLSRADADEKGRASSGGPRYMKTVFR